MLHYVYFGTNDLKRAIAFYQAALAPLACPAASPATRMGSSFGRLGHL